MQPRPLADLTDREPLDAVHPPDLRPLLHADHTLLLARSSRSSESPDPAGRTRPRARWATFRPAQVDQYSAGARRNYGSQREDYGSQRVERAQGSPATVSQSDSFRLPAAVARSARGALRGIENVDKHDVPTAVSAACRGRSAEGCASTSAALFSACRSRRVLGRSASVLRRKFAVHCGCIVVSGGRAGTARRPQGACSVPTRETWRRLGVVAGDRISEDDSVRGDLELADLGVVGACA